MTDSFQPGAPVTYEVAKRDGTSFAWPATVVEDKGRRVMIAYAHWQDGRRIHSLVRRHRVTTRDA